MPSYIQELILTNLLNTKNVAKYSQIKPPEVDNDLYNYHLQELVKKGYVEKVDSLYELSERGKKYVHIFDVLGNLHVLFKVSVLAYVIKESGQILLQKRSRHPYYGDVGVVAGKIKLGERVEVAAERKLVEETGLRCNFKLLGILRKTRRDRKGQIVEDTFFHVCYGENPTGDLVVENEHGVNYWSDFQVAIKAEKKNIVTGKYSVQVLENIFGKKFEFFYFHEEVILKDF